MITASVGAGSSLLLEPARELLFPLPDAASERRPRCCLSLTNLSPLNDVVFRVRTRNPDAFTVSPTHGLLAPGTSLQVVVKATARTCERLTAMDPRDLMTRQSSELFLVQSVEREDTLEPLNASSSSSLRAFWKKVSRDSITENKMVCRFKAAIPGFPPPLPASEITQDDKLFSRSMSSASLDSMEYRSSRDDGRRLSLSRRESRSSRSRSGSSSERSRLNRSFSNQFTPPEEMRGDSDGSRSSNHSFASDASFHTTIEPPVMDRRRLRDSVLTSISVNDGSVSDTMLTALSTDTAAGEATHELGPLQYHIQPSNVLSFKVKAAPRFWGGTSLFVVNSSQKDCLTFKVRTSNQSGYVVKPSRGLVSTTNAQEVFVSLCAPRDEDSFDPAKREAKDGFMIEVANISRDKYDDLMKLDERKRSREISSLWSFMPRRDRQSTMLSVSFKMDGSDSGSITRESSASPPARPQAQSLKTVVQAMGKLSTSSSTESPESTSEEKPGSRYQYSDSDESAFTIGPTPVPTEVGDDSDSDAGGVAYGSASNATKDPAVIVVSADRMDTVDFSNPKLSFFI
ncbi:hypothetical protein PHYSODRAFT_466812 [Phytophthora sojae]|uniref:MSP domain-containing protein n=1 Tax=Phytophthora sojae (strain P6497) TaxID=1094619 RepID=G4YN86_PHYSP|nr:hypothetical protein PHYSODRAFT_466812 [Phytophthora sojae]EGZ30039.1 hypothetical protein PHYSODRAFT_466812 [Phytophthora sojae]|eukprot:XP_009517314.1 hypothetical protein PHYSODRAFT_466812 [Phytophthora sojae]